MVDEALDYNDDRLELISLIDDNQAMRFFSTKGYSTVAIGVHTISPDIKIQSDYVFKFQENLEVKKFLDDFHWLLVEMSMIRPFTYIFEHKIVDNLDYLQYSRLYDLNKITQLSDIPSPKFVYAHILLPHAPFIFDKYGNKINWNDRANYQDKEIYLEQLIFTTERVETTIDSLLKQYPESKPPIIIIQSDHGLRTYREGKELDYISEDDQYKVLNAFLLPGYDYQSIDDAIPSVEILPLVIEYYVNATIQPLGD